MFSKQSLHNFSLKGGVDRNDLWPPSVGNSWRTTDDIQDNWASMMENICNDKLDESDLAATSAMMFIDYSTSPECIYPI